MGGRGRRAERAGRVGRGGARLSPGAPIRLLAALGCLAAWAGCVEPDREPPPDATLPTAAPAPEEDEPELEDRVSTSLVAYVEEILQLPRRCVPIRFPTAGQAAAYRRGLRLLLADRLRAARLVLDGLGFDVLRLRDGEALLFVVHERQPRARGGWGMVVVNPHARTPLVLEAPHPVHDAGTGAQAAGLMLALQARALVLSTTYRCASGMPSRCSGRTGACRQQLNRGRYKVSDVAHEPRSAFHAAHVALLSAEPWLVAVQLHGFGRRPGRRQHLIFSDGTKLPGGRQSHSNALARRTRRLLPRRRRRIVRSCNERDNLGFLCGTHNVQGRWTNGSVDPCRRRSQRSSNRFVQVEQSKDARTPGGLIEPGLLQEVLLHRWPPGPPRRRVRTPRGRTFPLSEEPGSYGLDHR